MAKGKGKGKGKGRGTAAEPLELTHADAGAKPAKDAKRAKEAKVSAPAAKQAKRAQAAKLPKAAASKLTKEARAPKVEKAPKEQKAPKVEKAPKAAKASKEEKAATKAKASKEPKVPKAAKEPKALKTAKAAKSPKAATAKGAKAAKAPPVEQEIGTSVTEDSLELSSAADVTVGAKSGRRSRRKTANGMTSAFVEADAPGNEHASAPDSSQSSDGAALEQASDLPSAAFEGEVTEAADLEAAPASAQIEHDSSDGSLHEDEALDDAGANVEDTSQYLKGLVEAILFVSDRPIELKELARTVKIDRKRCAELLEDLNRDYKERGVYIEEVAGGFAFRTNPLYSSYVRKYLAQRPVRLSRAQLETLAIVAYRQPITKPEVDDIRGVDCGPVLKGLLDRELIRILGKKDEAGRPMLYGTSPQFLELFNLESLRDLPTLREFTELSDDSRLTYENELGEDAPRGPVNLGAEPEAAAVPDSTDAVPPVAADAGDSELTDAIIDGNGASSDPDAASPEAPEDFGDDDFEDELLGRSRSEIVEKGDTDAEEQGAAGAPQTASEELDAEDDDDFEDDDDDDFEDDDEDDDDESLIDDGDADMPGNADVAGDANVAGNHDFEDDFGDDDDDFEDDEDDEDDEDE